MNFFEEGFEFYRKLFFKPIFKEKHLYGQILLYLYEHPDKEHWEDELRDRFKKDDPAYLDKQLSYLERDELIVVDVHFYGKSGKRTLKAFNEGDDKEKTFRISHSGFSFVSGLIHNRRSNTVGIIAIAISFFTIIVSVIPGALQVDEAKKANNIADEINKRDKERLDFEKKASIPDTVVNTVVKVDTIIIHDTVKVYLPAKKKKPHK